MHIIAIEGTDYSGKSTQIDLLIKFLTDQGYKVAMEHPPGGGVYGDEIYNLTFGKWKTDISPKTRFYQFLATTQNLYDNVIPKHEEGGVDYLILDRCLLSTYVYQALSEETVTLEMLDMLMMNIIPKKYYNTLTFQFELTFEELDKRRKARTDKEDGVYDNKGIEWYTDLIKKYNVAIDHIAKQARNVKYNCFLGEVEYVDATRSIEDVSKFIRNVVSDI